MPITAGLAITAVGGLAKSVTSMVDLGKTNHELENMHRPTKELEQEWLNNNSLTESRANQGLSDASKAYYTTETQRGLAAGISAGLQGGGSPNDLQALYESHNRDLDKVMMRDAELQNQNIQYYMKSNADLAGQKAINWGVNELQPYEDKMASLTSKRAADIQNAWGGVTDVAGAVTAYGVSKQNDDLIQIEKAKVANQSAGAATPARGSVYTNTYDPKDPFMTGSWHKEDPFPVPRVSLPQQPQPWNMIPNP